MRAALHRAGDGCPPLVDHLMAREAVVEPHAGAGRAQPVYGERGPGAGDVGPDDDRALGNFHQRCLPVIRLDRLPMSELRELLRWAADQAASYRESLAERSVQPPV